MIRPMPAEMSQVNVPTFVRPADWAMDGTGNATAATTAMAARALRGLGMTNPIFK
jgi:hypothetical protein